MVHNAEEHFQFLPDRDEFQMPSQEKEKCQFQAVHFSQQQERQHLHMATAAILIMQA
jgi:hypothetical protein